MNKVIYKYAIDDSSHKQESILLFEYKSKLLHIEEQRGDLWLWFELNIDIPNNHTRTFYVMHTGKKFDDDNIKFRKTVIYSQSYVVHVYEKEEDFISDDEMSL